MPFDFKTPIGYLIAFALQYITIKYLYMFGAAIVSFEISIYLLITALIEDVKRNISSINELVKSKEKRRQMSEKLRDLIQFHSNVKQLS